MYTPYRFGIDSTYILVIIGVILTLLAQAKVRTTYAKYNEILSSSRMSGAQAAKKILLYNGIYDVAVEKTEGTLTDHYDPSKKVLKLSADVYDGISIAALSIAAHECGHAIQDSVEYTPLKLRTAMVPAANLGSRAAWYFILAGLILGGTGSPLCQIGVVLFAAAIAFELVTLPVELNASNRAIVQLEQINALREEEKSGAKKVLFAAALTYLASAAAGLLQLLRLIMLYGGNRNRRN